MKLTLDLAASRIGIEGDGEELLTVLKLAREIAPSLAHIEIHTIAGRAPEVPKTPQKQGVSTQHDNRNGAGNASGVSSGQTLRQFVRTLKLDSIPERIAAVAYYKKTYENVESFSPKEMAAWFSVCAFQKPSQMPVAIFNAAKNHDYVVSIGHAKWRLTTNGENLVIGKQNDNDTSER